jgi:Cu+-exporting ATPase
MQSGSVMLDIRGMWCTSCANALERTFERQPGVLGAKVSFASESASLEWDPAATSLDRILLQAGKLGYECVPDGEAHDRHAHLAKVKGDLSMRLVVALFFSMWVMPAQWTLYVAPAGSVSPAVQYWLALFAGMMTVPIMGYCAVPFFRAGWRTLRARAGDGFPGCHGGERVLLAVGMALVRGRVERLLRLRRDDRDVSVGRAVARNDGAKQVVRCREEPA